MDSISPTRLENFLKNYGWSYQPAPNNAWYTGWQGERRSYPLTIRLTDTWVLFQVTPLMKLGVDWYAWPELSRFLLERNHDFHMVKIGIDEYGEVSLSLQLFNYNFAYEVFSDALGIIGHYTEIFYDELLQELHNMGFFNGYAKDYLRS